MSTSEPAPPIPPVEDAPLACDCEPIVYHDGSKTHEDTCPVYPWCPHEVGAYSCLMPCGCSCRSCKRLGEADARYSAPTAHKDPA